MTQDEHEQYLRAKKAVDSQLNRNSNYEDLMKKLKNLKSTKDSLKRRNFKSLETNDVYSCVGITDSDFAKEKVCEIYDREIELLLIEIGKL